MVESLLSELFILNKIRNLINRRLILFLIRYAGVYGVQVIPLEIKANAQVFLQDHRGTRMLTTKMHRCCCCIAWTKAVYRTWTYISAGNMVGTAASIWIPACAGMSGSVKSTHKFFGGSYYSVMDHFPISREQHKPGSAIEDGGMWPTGVL